MLCGNTTELGDVSDEPWKSYLFFLTVLATLESDYPEIRLVRLEEHLAFRGVGALIDWPLKIRVRLLFHTRSYP